MKKIFILFASVICLVLIISCESNNNTEPEDIDVADVLFINEFMADNDSVNPDENGDYDDWVEIYNSSDMDIDIGGMYISDDSDDLTAWQIPTTAPDSTTVPAGGFILVWCDKETDQGILHVNIKLSKDGETIILTESDGTTIVDSLSFGIQNTDISEGRNPDGTDSWMTFSIPTPGTSNNQ
ncbi:MAG: lamin tail domain-containing protein [Candidatus Marinimicrobia bacterium]|nr:lamin tail domain-containing protein [Candidatus Neomarinimicrobiota bacterium]